MNKLPLATFAISLLIASSAHAASITGQGSWETTLQGRDLDGNTATFEAYYDTVLNITWLADANFARTSGFDADGQMSWSAANVWAAGLNPYGSDITGWRLPTVRPVDGNTADDNLVSYSGSEDRVTNMSAPGTLFAGSTASEMAYMFYNTLGDKAYCSIASVYPNCIIQSGWGLTNSGPFSNIQAYLYWSSTEYALATANAWDFNFNNGYQVYNNKTISNYAWAVHDGDTGNVVPASVVPVPAALWLFGTGLLSLLGVARRKVCR